MVGPARDSPGAIDVRVNRLAQLFDSMDPSPFHEKSLDAAAHRYILECALEHTPGEPLRLRLHLPHSSESETSGASRAIHNHFRLEAEQARRVLRRRMRVGRFSLLAGVVILALCSLLRSVLPATLGGPMGFIGEGLLILGWVALWRPVDVLLFERWESRDEQRWLEQLSAIPIDIVHDAD